MLESEHTANNEQSAPALIVIGHSRPIVDIHFSALTETDKYYMISASKDNTPMIHDGLTGDWIGTLVGHHGPVWSARLSRRAHRAATGSSDACVKLWDTSNGQELASLAYGHTVRTVNFSPDNTRIVAGGQDKKLKIYDLYRPDAKPLEGKSCQGTIRATAWHPSHQDIIFSGGEDGNVYVHDVRAMHSPVTCFQVDGVISCMNLTENGGTVYWAANRRVYFWSLALGLAHDPSMVTNYEMSKLVSSVAVHPRGEQFVYGSDADFDIHICDGMSGKELDVRQGHRGHIHSVSYSPDGELYATGSEDSEIRLWQTDPSKPYGLWERLEAH